MVEFCKNTKMIWGVEAVGELIYTGILIGINIVDPIAVDWFFTKIAQRKNERAGFRVIALLGIIGYVVVQPFLLEMFAENVVISYSINNCFIFLKILYIFAFYDISKRKAFIYLIIQFFVDTVVECILTILLMALSQFTFYSVSGNNFINLIAILVMQGISIWLLRFLVEVDKQYSCAIHNSRIYLMLLLSFIIDQVVMGVLFCKTYGQENVLLFLELSISPVYEIVILLCSVYCIAKYKKREQEYQEVIEFTDKQIKMLNHTQEKISKSQKIIHDMTNHLCTLQLMAEKNMTHEIIQYVQKLIPEVKRGRVTDVTNSILAVILFEKRAKAKQHNVHLECDVRVDDIKMPMHELNSILNNVIDNAIEAAEKVKNKRERIVEFCVYVKQNNLVMECINPYAEEPKIDSEGIFLTSKTDKNSHGKGIRIIYDYVLQNNGDVDIRYCNGKFSIKIIFTDEIAVLE